MDLSIIIINYNTLALTKQCIDCVFEKTRDLQFEVILVDNASTDGSKDYFSKEKRIKYIYNSENIGFGKANNIGAKDAQGRNLFFLNSDTMLINNAAKILSDYLDKNETVGACGGNLYNKDLKPVYSYSLLPPSIILDVNKLMHNKPGKLFYKGSLSFNNTESVLDVSFISGADLMVKREIFNNIGGFNTAFFMYFEDAELCYRIKKAGYTIVSVPTSKIIHLVSVSVKKAEKNKSRKKKEMFEESRALYHSLTNKSKIYIWFASFLNSKVMEKLFFI